MTRQSNLGCFYSNLYEITDAGSLIEHIVLWVLEIDEPQGKKWYEKEA